MEEQIELIRIDLKQLSNYRQDDFHYKGCTNDILLHLKSAEIQHQNLQKELSIANDKLNKIEEYVIKKLTYIDNAEDQEIILEIIKGEEEK